MKKFKLGIVGCGFLGNIIGDAWRKGLLDEYEFVGCVSRTMESTQALAEKTGCKACENLAELLALKPDYVVEAASPAVMKEIAEKVLRNNSHLVVLSRRLCRCGILRANQRDSLRDGYSSPSGLRSDWRL